MDVVPFTLIFHFHYCRRRKGRWLLFIFITLTPDFLKKSLHFMKAVLLFPKSLFLMRISNQHPLSVRWGDNTCNCREAEKCDSPVSPRRLCRRCGAWGDSAGIEKAEGAMGHWEKWSRDLCCTQFPFALSQNIPFFQFIIKKGDYWNSGILEVKLSANLFWGISANPQGQLWDSSWAFHTDFFPFNGHKFYQGHQGFCVSQ